MPAQPPKQQITRASHVLDAKDQILGRLATEVATLLRGKTKPSFESHIDGGDYVTVINAASVKVTGNKLHDKIYARHSGYPGGLKEISLEALLASRPEKVIEFAVYGMLPKNRLRAGWMRRLKVVAGETK